MHQRTFYTEIAYLCGIITLALGTAFMEKANLGMSMVVAPAYLIYLKLSGIWSFVTFGMVEYSFQALLLAVMMLALHKYKAAYLFSFGTAVIYGLTLDGSMKLVALIGFATLPWRITLFFTGMVVCAIGVSFMFHTYLSPEVYELFVKELASAKTIKISLLKTTYDCVSCFAAICLSFAFFGMFHFEGVKIGTVVCAALNGTTIGLLSRWMERHWRFKDGLALRRLFQ